MGLGKYISPPSLVHLSCFVLNMLFSLLLLLGLVVECIFMGIDNRFVIIIDSGICMNVVVQCNLDLVTLLVSKKTVTK